MSNSENRKLVEDWYLALATGDLALFAGIHHPECVYNISGHSPISGQVSMKALMESVLPIVFGSLDVEKFQFSKKYKIVCSDDHRVVGIMEADGPGKNGVRYDQRYVHMFAFRDGQLGTVWEFFDTALANAVMFPDPSQVIPGVDRDGFEY